MATDLFELIEQLQREVQAPGSTTFPDAVNADWLGNLQDGFWEAVLDGTISGEVYDEDEGTVTPDLPKTLQRLVVFYAGLRIVRNQLRELQTMFRTKAGPVEYEVRQDWQVLKALLDDMIKRRNTFIWNLSEDGTIEGSYVDGLQAVDDSLVYNDTYWAK